MINYSFAKKIINKIKQTCRCFLFIFVKFFIKLFYFQEIKWLSKKPTNWQNISLIIVLNHTSLFEFIYGAILPTSYFKLLSKKLVLPVASETLKKLITGSFFKFFSAKTVGLSRKRDQSWTYFLNHITDKNICIFMPEGRMKRVDGFDKDGNKMTLRGGTYELMQKFRKKQALIIYSQGLHHILPPGNFIPRVFKKVKAKVELINIQKYLEKFDENLSIKEQLRLDLEKKRDKYCN